MSVDNRGVVELSVVVPVYGCRGCLHALHERLRASLESAVGTFEIILVDDRSPDGAWEVIQELARRDPHVRGFRLSRNFGQSAAITAGFAQSRGRWTVVMDCDLQEPPEEIPRLYATAREGYDIVHTKRRDRRGSPLRGLAGRLYWRASRFFLRLDVGTEHGTLSIASRKAVDAFLSLGDVHREYLLALSWLGFRQTTIEVERTERHEGRSSYTLPALVKLAVDGLFFQTTVLLRWIVVAGFLIALSGALLAAYYLFSYLISDPLPGFTSIAVLLLLLSGFVLISLGVIGLYVGKVFEQVKGRPLYLIDTETDAEIEAPAARPTLAEPLA